MILCITGVNTNFLFAYKKTGNWKGVKVNLSP